MTGQTSRAERKPSGCGLLAEILDENGLEAQAIRARFHATMVSRWKHGARLPDLQSAILLSEITAGRIAVDAWKLPEQTAA